LCKKRRAAINGSMDIRELARHLGLSIGTVSRALNDRKDVSPTTRQRVVEAAAKHGYIPNQSGRTLRSGRTGTVGFMLTLEHDSAIHGDPFFMALLEGLQNGLSEHDLDLVVLLARKGEDALTFLRRHVSRGTVDGWVLSGTQHDDPRIPFLLDRTIPFVALGRTAIARDYAWIDLDFEGVMADAMTLLTEAGHRRIGLVAPPATINNSHIVVRCYRDALVGAGIPFDSALVHHGETDESDGEATASELMAMPERPAADGRNRARGRLSRAAPPGPGAGARRRRDRPARQSRLSRPVPRPDLLLAGPRRSGARTGARAGRDAARPHEGYRAPCPDLVGHDAAPGAEPQGRALRQNVRDSWRSAPALDEHHVYAIAL
jgi:DNA-binding LacI/PurR family transcriptional regulator